MKSFHSDSTRKTAEMAQFVIPPGGRRPQGPSEASCRCPYHGKLINTTKKNWKEYPENRKILKKEVCWRCLQNYDESYEQEARFVWQKKKQELLNNLGMDAVTQPVQIFPIDSGAHCPAEKHLPKERQIMEEVNLPPRDNLAQPRPPQIEPIMMEVELPQQIRH